jgi:hypothetical protein
MGNGLVSSAERLTLIRTWSWISFFAFAAVGPGVVVGGLASSGGGERQTCWRSERCATAELVLS